MTSLKNLLANKHDKDPSLVHFVLIVDLKEELRDRFIVCIEIGNCV